MHELSIAQKIVQIVQEKLTEAKIETEVEKVLFRAGKLSAIIPDSLSFHFDVVKKDLPQFKNAVLEVEEMPLKAFCSHCNQVFELHEPIFVCPKCEGSLTLQEGQEMWVESISVKDPKTPKP